MLQVKLNYSGPVSHVGMCNVHVQRLLERPVGTKHWLQLLQILFKKNKKYNKSKAA